MYIVEETIDPIDITDKLWAAIGSGELRVQLIYYSHARYLRHNLHLVDYSADVWSALSNELKRGLNSALPNYKLAEDLESTQPLNLVNSGGERWDPSVNTFVELATSAKAWYHTLRRGSSEEVINEIGSTS